MDISGARTTVIISFIVYSLILLGIGEYSRRSMAKTKLDDYLSEFYTGGRGMGTLVIVFMLAAGLCSAGTFLGSPGLAYSVGLVFPFVVLSQSFMNFVVLGQIGKKVGIIARRIDAQSYQDILTYRYNKSKAVRWFSAIAIWIFYTSNVVAQLSGGSRLIQVMTGLPYVTALMIFGIVILIYTVTGGIKGVSTATVFQGIVMTLAIVMLFVMLLAKVSPLEATYRTIIDIDPNLVTPWVWNPAYAFSMFVSLGLVTIGQPHGAMGCLMYKDTKGMHNAMIIGAVVVFIWSAMIVWAGNLARAVVPNLDVPDYVIPYLSVNIMPGWMAGLTLAGVAAAIQSSIASVIIVISSALVRDMYLTIKPTKDPKKIKQITTIATIIAALIPLIIAINPPSALQWFILFAIGGLTSSFFWPMLLGLYWWRTNEYGALAGMIGGMVTFILVQGNIIPFNLGMHGIVMGLIVSGLLTVFVSLATPKPPKKVIEVFWGKSKPNESV